jgi:hypothetical protein
VGRPGDLTGLRIDRDTGRIDMPAGLPQSLQESLRALVRPERTPQPGFERAYRKRWLGRIIDHYRQARAHIVIVRIPFHPIPMASAMLISSDAFVRQAAANPQVTVLDPHLFDDLERPEFFFDSQHMNARGRAMFTERLARVVRETVGIGNPRRFR